MYVNLLKVPRIYMYIYILAHKILPTSRILIVKKTVTYRN